MGRVPVAIFRLSNQMNRHTCQKLARSFTSIWRQASISRRSDSMALSGNPWFCSHATGDPNS